jgi:hypothetical protein
VGDPDEGPTGRGPGVEADLRVLVEQIQAQLPARIASPADHAVAAGRDVNITASGGGIATGAITPENSHLACAVTTVVPAAHNS